MKQACDIIIDVLSRLPVGAILSCKCVCKSWLDFLETREFANIHLSKSKSAPGLAFALYPEKLPLVIKLIEYKDGQEGCYTTTINLRFAFASSPIIEASADGLLLIMNGWRTIYLCNPITRQYIELSFSDPARFKVTSYGFGASKITGEYKVVRITAHDHMRTFLRDPSPDCNVYTLGTRSWRSVASDNLLNYIHSKSATLVNGNLHWFACDLKGSSWISCFDLETEIFTTFSAPPFLPGTGPHCKHIIALEDCLCLCDNTYVNNMVIWSMSEYGVDKSWTRKYCFGNLGYELGDVLPIKILKDGDMFIAHGSTEYPRLLSFSYYSSKNQTLRGIHIHGDRCFVLHIFISQAFFHSRVSQWRMLFHIDICILIRMSFFYFPIGTS